jgi:hypothetical protein
VARSPVFLEPPLRLGFLLGRRRSAFGFGRFLSRGILLLLKLPLELPHRVLEGIVRVVATEVNASSHIDPLAFLGSCSSQPASLLPARRYVPADSTREDDGWAFLDGHQRSLLHSE